MAFSLFPINISGICIILQGIVHHNIHTPAARLQQLYAGSLHRLHHFRHTPRTAATCKSLGINGKMKRTVIRNPIQAAVYTAPLQRRRQIRRFIRNHIIKALQIAILHIRRNVINHIMPQHIRPPAHTDFQLHSFRKLRHTFLPLRL